MFVSVEAMVIEPSALVIEMLLPAVSGVFSKIELELS